MPRLSVKFQTKSKRKGSKRAKSTTLAAPRVRKAVQGMINRTLARNAENKTVGWTVHAGATADGPITDMDVRWLLGSIIQGTDSNERVGDRVRPKSLTVRGVIGLNPYDNPNNKPILATVFILACKDKRTNSLIAPPTGSAGMQDLLKPNIYGSEELPFDGTTGRQLWPVNRDRFRVYYHRTFRIAPGTIAAGPREFDYVRWSYRFKKLPTTLTWDEQNGDDCNNFAPFVVVGWSYADNSVDIPPTSRLILETHSQFTYEDA